MTSRPTLLIPAIFLVLSIVAFIGLLKSYRSGASSKDSGSSEQGNAHSPLRKSDPRLLPQTKRERNGEADAKALRDLEIEFDQILPARFPQQPSSLCDATLKPGESLVLGGFKRSDGTYEFTRLELEPVSEGDSSANYQIRAISFGISPEKVAEAGLVSLLSTAKTRIQKSVIFPSGEMKLDRDAIKVLSSPSLVMGNGVAHVTVSRDQQSHGFSLMVSPTEDGESTRIKMRVEGPQGN